MKYYQNPSCSWLAMPVLSTIRMLYHVTKRREKLLCTSQASKWNDFEWINIQIATTINLKATHITTFWRGISVISIVFSIFQKYRHSASWFQCMIFQTLCWNLSVLPLQKTIAVLELTKCNHNKLTRHQNLVLSFGKSLSFRIKLLYFFQIFMFICYIMINQNVFFSDIFL